MNEGPIELVTISLADLDGMLARARSEQWNELAIIPLPRGTVIAADLVRRGWPASHVLLLDVPLKTSVIKLAGLNGLTSLNLSGNNIGADGARAVASLTGLTSLNLGGNNIGDNGARAVASLTGLTSLNLSNNNIGDDGARAVASLAGLALLNLGGNNIGDNGARALLAAWFDSPQADRLRYMDLTENEDLSSVLPPEVLETRDAQAILAAYRRYCQARDQATLRPLNEAKLLVVGNEAVGKTSLIRYLTKNEPRNESEAKTIGAAIHEKIETQTWSPDGCSVALNIWDFDGQEIMHGTHRFFLTERSLYLLVLEDRREDDRSVYEWLKTIRNRGGDSPVIVVINKCDGGSCNLRLDENGLRKDYPNIVGFVRTSCDPNKSAAATIAGLRKLIVTTLADNQRLKHVRDPIPASWLCVKKTVAKRARDVSVLKHSDFEQLCLHAGDGTNGESITDADEQRALLRLLHDLGVAVAHGLDPAAPAAVREITLLDPNWLTRAIYMLLTSQTVTNQGGEFDRDQLNELLDKNLYPPQRHEFILDMMENPEIGLCFELPDTDHRRYLIPQALPTSEPDYDMWPDNSLRFRFEYQFLPPGLIPRFIVQAHRNLTDKPTRWRTGVVLRASGCRILVRGDRDRRRIDISVDGPRNAQRAALNVVLNDLEAVHRKNPEIGPKALVPLPHNRELHESYDHLLKLEEQFGPDYEYLPSDSDRTYKVYELLDGVRWDRVPTPDERREPADYRIKATGHSQVTIIAGKVHTGGGKVDVGRRVQAEPPRLSWSSVFNSWRFYSLACAAVVVALAIVVLLLPSNEWKAIVAGLATLGIVVFLFMLKMDPAYYYRRLLGYVIAGGMLINGIGFSLDVLAARHESAVFGLHWDGTVSGWFYLAWAVVIVVLVWADLRQPR